MKVIIKSKIFDGESSLNEFIQKNDVKVISIETRDVEYNTGLPLPDGGYFFAKKDVLKLWFEEKK